MSESWDVIVVGAGPAGAAAALGALAERPSLRVLLLDRAEFPRDKACGDGIAPHVLDVLAGVGVRGLLDAHLPIRCLDLSYRGWRVARMLRRPAWVVPRETFDARLVEAAVEAGAELRRYKVRTVRAGDGVILDDDLAASVLIGADGANSLVREAVGAAPPKRKAFALRGYAPTPVGRDARQIITFAPAGPPAYAWSFDRGDGLANVGYGEFPDPRRPAPSKGSMLDRLDELLPGSTSDGTAWRGHHLPLSSWTWTQPDGPILLAGDAAGLINPMTGEGIYYAVATGVLAGRTAAMVASRTDGDAAGARYRARVRTLLASHLRHTATAARLTAIPAILGAGIRAAEHDQRVFDDLVEVGLGRGLLTRRTVTGLVRNWRTSA